MPYFDINTAVGHWPFRQLPNNTTETLRAYLSGQGIAHAAVASTHAIFYMNPQDANIELANALQYHHDFFTGIATLNPMYAAWEKDLDTCVNTFGFRALRLLPKYHNYCLNDPAAQAIIAKAGELGIPVIIPGEIVNYRQRHWMEPEKPLPFKDIANTAAKFPDVNFIFTDCAAPISPENPHNIFYELTRYQSALGGALTKLIKSVGAEHVLFGTGSPFKSAEPSILKLAVCDIDERERSLVSHLNAKRLLNL